MRGPALLAVLLWALALPQATRIAAAQPNVLRPVTVETYRVLQRASRGAGWPSTAYRNYLVGLFEGLLVSEGSAADRRGTLFCLPPGKGVSIAATFEWLENELNEVVERAQPKDLVSRIFVSHLTAKFPCQG
jgi:hypothetical protein